MQEREQASFMSARSPNKIKGTLSLKSYLRVLQLSFNNYKEFEASLQMMEVDKVKELSMSIRNLLNIKENQIRRGYPYLHHL